MADMRKLLYKLNRWMQGRYGDDALNHFLFGIALVGLILNIFVNSVILNGIVFIIFVVDLYRALSKNIVARSIENDRYRKIQRKIVRSWKAFVQNRKDKTHKTFLCPHCVQMIRVPRHKGKIEIRCPHCHQTFDKTT